MSLEKKLLPEETIKKAKSFVSNNFNPYIASLNAGVMGTLAGVSDYIASSGDLITSLGVTGNQMVPTFILGGITSKSVQNRSNNNQFKLGKILGYISAITPSVFISGVGSYGVQTSLFENPNPEFTALVVTGVSIIASAGLCTYERNKELIGDLKDRIVTSINS